MNLTVYQWLGVGHIFGFIMWVGCIVGLQFMLQRHAETKASEAFVDLEKRMGMAMDIGATMAIVFGLSILFYVGAGVYLKGSGWMHTKLLLVAGLIAVHALTRIRIKKYRTGEVTPFPTVMIPIVEVLVLGIIIMVVVRPF